MTLKAQKEEFLLKHIFFSNSISGAFQRNRVYSKGAEDIGPEDWQTRSGMKNLIFEQLQKSPDFLVVDIVDCIESLRGDVSKRYKEILRNGQMTFGTVQKIVNLYLKYLWVAGLLGEKSPPHCPVDGQVLRAIKWNGVSWPKMEKKDYEQVIKEITSKAKADGFQSIAEWELEKWPFSK